MKIEKVDYLSPSMNASGEAELFVYLDSRRRTPFHFKGMKAVRAVLKRHGARKPDDLAGAEWKQKPVEGKLAHSIVPFAVRMAAGRTIAAQRV